MNYTFNLKKRWASRRDFHFHKSHYLGAIGVPDFFIPSQFPVQDAENCTAFSTVAARESEIPQSSFDPQIFWQDELKFAGVATSDGFDIEVPAAVAVKTGFCPTGNPTIRQNQASAYYFIHPSNGLDLFDSVMEAVYTTKYPAQGGLDWHNEWTNAPQGIIDAVGKSSLGGHLIRIVGKKTVNGYKYAGLPNTWGTGVGDGGIYWMRQDVFNLVFPRYGIVILSDDPSVRVKTLGLINALYVNVLTLLRTLFSI